MSRKPAYALSPDTLELDLDLGEGFGAAPVEAATWSLDAADVAAAAAVVRTGVDPATLYDVWDRRSRGDDDAYWSQDGLYCEADDAEVPGQAITYGIVGGGPVASED